MKTKTKDRLLTAGAVLLISSGSVSLPGCATTDFSLQYQHVSHLSAGWPNGPSREEDSLDYASICGERSFIKALEATAEVCYGYRLRDKGFYGPKDIVALNVKVPLFVRSRRTPLDYQCTTDMDCETHEREGTRHSPEEL